MPNIQLNSASGRISFAVAVSIAVIFIIGTSLKDSSVKGSLIWIEAEAAEKVVEPLQVIDMEGASEDKGITAIGSHFRKEGYAKYKFTVEEDGEYIIWGRCFWSNVCTNSFLLSVDKPEFEGIGEDPLTNQWHWVMGPRFTITKGEHTLYLWNREVGSQIDKFLITANAAYVPEGMGTTSSVSEDFESGLTPENFSFLNKSDWKIVSEDAKNKSLLHVNITASSPVKEQVLIHHDYGDNYIYSLAFKASKDLQSKVSVYFSYKDKLNYYCVDMEGRDIKLFQVTRGSQQLLQKKSFNDNLVTTDFRDLSVCRSDDHYYIKNNGNLVFQLPAHASAAGSLVGFGASQAGVYFDNISVSANEKVNYNENFHEPEFGAFKERPEISAEFLQNLKKGRRNWWIINGDWNSITLDGFEGIEARGSAGQPASIVFGTDFWRNYELQVAARFNNADGIGVIFNFQDRNNYSLFRWQKEHSGWKYRIDKIESGSEVPIAEAVAPAPKRGLACWYKINVGIKDDSIKVLMNDEPVFVKKDKRLEGDGKSGFWSMGDEGAYFDDILVSSAGNANSLKQTTVYTYNLFTPQLNISTSYSDWEPSYDKAIQLLTTGAGPFVCLNKEMFEPAFINNRRYFNPDFKIILDCEEIPVDIDANFSFTVNTAQGDALYNFTLATDSIIVRKNAQTIFSGKINPSPRSYIELSRLNSRWKVKCQGNKLAEFADKTPWKSTKIGVGFSGVGKAQILLHQIIVENL